MGDRCSWCGIDPLYVAYHDFEWGVPEFDGRMLWETLNLEAFQAGLSWYTILKKREGFREAFEGFHPEVIATWGEPEVERLLQDPGIVRHRGKIQATIGNARAYLQLGGAEAFSKWAWDHVDGTPIDHVPNVLDDVPGKTPLAEQMSKELKKLGFKFCGPTIVYAWMQAVGMVNDHVLDCETGRALRLLSTRK
ncbi:MAG: DNA-3-methyladenine glycosylase I [Maritimibacter sp.]